MQIEEPASSSKTKREKKKLDFSQVTEDQSNVKGKNILNLPFSDSESKPVEENSPGHEGIEPAIEDMQETEVTIPSLEIPESSTNIKIRKSLKVKRLKEKIVEFEVLERVIKSRYQTLRKS